MTGAVSTRLGHSDASVTLRKYGHLYDKNTLRLGATIDQAGEAFARVPHGDENERSGRLFLVALFGSA